MTKKETITYVLKQFWRHQTYRTRKDTLVGILICIPLGCWIFSILAIFESSPPGTFGWFWLYWIAFVTTVIMCITGLIWRIYDIIKHMK